MNQVPPGPAGGIGGRDAVGLEYPAEDERAIRRSVPAVGDDAVRIAVYQTLDRVRRVSRAAADRLGQVPQLFAPVQRRQRLSAGTGSASGTRSQVRQISRTVGA